MAESCNVLINLEPLQLADSIVRLDQYPPEFVESSPRTNATHRQASTHGTTLF